MLSKIHIKNFQSHQDSTLELFPGLNIICGQSDSGKSSIIRAIRWALENRPRGNSIVRDGTRKASVSLFTPDNDIIIHNRTKSNSSYQVNDLDFPKMGKDVPQEVLDLLPLGDENIQYQMDIPFLVMESPGKIAELFNDVTNLTKADKIGRELDRRRKECNRKYKDKQEEIESVKQELELPKYKVLDKLSKLVDKVEDLYKKKEELNIKLDCIKSLIDWHDKLDSELKLLDNVVNSGNKLKELLDKRKPISNKISNLKSLIADLENAESDIAKIDEASKYKGELSDFLDSIGELQETKGKKSKRFNLISDLLGNIIESEEHVESIEEQMKELRSDYQDILSKITHCPMCGAEIETEKQRERIMKS